MQEMKKYSFEYDVSGTVKNVVGLGVNQYEAENNAVIKMMRMLDVKHTDIKFLKVSSVENLGQWI